MESFEYYTPTRVVFGKGTEGETGRLAREAGATKVLVHYGSASAKKSGLIDRICDSLDKAGLAHVELGGVVPNPRLSLVQEGIAFCRAEGVDLVLGVGGGSAIDSAKAIAYGVPYEGDVWDFYSGKAISEIILPVGVVLTVAAAGSEMSNSSVITKDDTLEKRGYNADLGRPRFAVINPELTLTLPPFPTACGVSDILMHTLERYFSKSDPMEITAGIADALMRTVMDAGRVVARKPENYDARANLLWAGALSHNGLTGCGNGMWDGSCHQLAHELSGEFDTAHGAALTAIWGSWARYVYREEPSRFARLAIEVLDIPDEADDEEIALAGIEEMESFFWSIEMPTSLEDLELGIDEAKCEELAKRCSRNGTRTIGQFMELEEADMAAIYKAALTPPEDLD